MSFPYLFFPTRITPISSSLPTRLLSWQLWYKQNFITQNRWKDLHNHISFCCSKSRYLEWKFKLVFIPSCGWRRTGYRPNYQEISNIIHPRWSNEKYAFGSLWSLTWCAGRDQPVWQAGVLPLISIGAQHRRATYISLLCYLSRKELMSNACNLQLS